MECTEDTPLLQEPENGVWLGLPLAELIHELLSAMLHNRKLQIQSGTEVAVQGAAPNAGVSCDLLEWNLIAVTFEQLRSRGDESKTSLLRVPTWRSAFPTWCSSFLRRFDRLS
jgi:hypothetical protein